MTTDPDEVTVGMSLPSRVVHDVRTDDIKLVALLLRDPNPIHFDVSAVARAGLGDRPVNQGGTTMAYVMNMLIALAGSRTAIRSITCSFRGNVFAGDDVELGGVVTAVEPAAEGSLVTCDVWADVVRGRRAVVGTATVLLTDVVTTAQGPSPG
jgi:acyl dehydratase